MDAAPTIPQDESPLCDQHRCERGHQPAVTDTVFTIRQNEPLVRQSDSHELGLQAVVTDTVLAMPRDQPLIYQLCSREQGHQPAIADAIPMIPREETPLQSARRRINFSIPPVAQQPQCVYSRASPGQAELDIVSGTGRYYLPKKWMTITMTMILSLATKD